MMSMRSALANSKSLRKLMGSTLEKEDLEGIKENHEVKSVDYVKTFDKKVSFKMALRYLDIYKITFTNGDVIEIFVEAE